VKSFILSKISKRKLILTAITLVVIGTIGYLSYNLFLLDKENLTLKDKIAQLESDFNDAISELLLAKDQNENLSTSLNAEKERVNDLADTVGNISGTVGTLKKLSETDKELLQKYSKIYFLNENYIPSRLTDIDEKYIIGDTNDTQIHSEVSKFLKKLLDEAEEDDISLLVSSAYRSFSEQITLKTGYKITYGAGTANRFSAEQGYSEHQLGTTVDFTTEALGILHTAFENTPSFMWLQDNAHKYGFVLSYPKGNKFYQYEPWHWRFVGVDLATKLFEENKFFYDLEQREIDKYLVHIFD